MEKTWNNRAWFMVLPVLVLVAVERPQCVRVEQQSITGLVGIQPRLTLRQSCLDRLPACHLQIAELAFAESPGLLQQPGVVVHTSGDVG